MLKRKIGPYCERLPGRFLPVLGSGATYEKLNARGAGLPKMSIFRLTRSLCWSTEVIVPVKFWNGPALICTLPPGENSSSRLILFSSFRICLSFAPHVSDVQARRSDASGRISSHIGNPESLAVGLDALQPATWQFRFCQAQKSEVRQIA